MLLQELFANDVTRDIPPVVYFHEQAPEKVAAEVEEYIITGGYEPGDPRFDSIQSAGIHEQFVRLLAGLVEDIQGSPALPAAWISGFYGSGKSSFAKLLGLALDGLTLPGGDPLSEALLQRDDSPKKAEFRKCWRQLTDAIDPIAVVFDIGAVARDDEQIHSAVKRQLQGRLGYCKDIHYVADYELKLELEGEWETFLQTAERVHGQPWEAIKDSPVADERFSQVMHEMNPSRYTEPLSWFESRAGNLTGIGSSAEETTRTIEQMLAHRASGKTLFIVVDEVSQYIFQNTNRMLALQSFVSALGQRLKGRVWLLATGQQKLEDSEDESNISKLKDRFPPKLRVHLAPTNIRDVVHKRLLKKKREKESELAALFERHRSDLALYGYECGAIAKESFLEVYPLLPGYVDLLMNITSNLRSRSTKAKGDDHAIRGLMQLLGELFREQKLGEQQLGTLITLDNIFDVQQTALDNDVQTTLARIFANEAVKSDPMAVRVAKVVALLELIQEERATTPELVAKCLYDQLGCGNREAAVTQALERLRELNLLSYSEKTGYKIQSAAGKEWDQERDRHTVTPDAVSELVAQKLKALLGTADNPSYKGNKFRWAAYYSDGRQRQDERLQVPAELAVVTVDFRYVAKDEQAAADWIRASSYQQNRIFWVVGDRTALTHEVKALAKSRKMLAQYESRRKSLSESKRRLLGDEQTRCDTLENRVKTAVVEAFLAGSLYFRGRQIDRQPYGSGFASSLTKLAEALLPEIYDRYVAVSVTDTELKQLLTPKLVGISSKFLGQLGIFEMDAGKYVATCAGEIPARVGQYVLDEGGSGGSGLLSHFGGPPFGYPADVVKACLVGLLRAGKVRIRPDAGSEVTSVQDPGAQDLFTKDRALKRADVLPPSDKGVSGRDRIAICRFFRETLQTDLERDNGAIADAVFNHFPQQARRLRELESRYGQLPERIELPDSLQKLQQALEKCMKSRQVEPTLLAVKGSLDALRDGIYELGTALSDLSDEKVSAVKRAMNVQRYQVAQLRQISRLGPVEAEARQIQAHFAADSARPWRDIDALLPAVEAIEQHYETVRLALIEEQEERYEAEKGRLTHRQGYYELTEAEAAQLWTLLRAAVSNTSQAALSPPLIELKEPARARLSEAKEKASRYFDDALAAKTGAQIIEINVTALLSNQEVSSMAEMASLLRQVSDSVADKLEGDDNIRVRLR